MEKIQVNFEDAMKELEQIAKDLEDNKIDLDTAVNKFEQGMKISKQCSEILENAEKRISVLIKDGKDYKEEDFAAEE